MWVVGRVDQAKRRLQSRLQVEQTRHIRASNLPANID